MTAAPSFSFLKIAAAAPPPSSSSSSSRTHHHHHHPHSLPPPTHLNPYSSSLTVRSYSQAEGPLRRPVAPSLPATPTPTPTLREPTPPSVVAPPPPQSKAAAKAEEGVITLEFQRQKAKELQEYFREKKLLEADKGPFFGFLPKNEIANGRWAMFGFAVGMLTEYATGSDFVDQVKILLSNFGILDLE